MDVAAEADDQLFVVEEGFRLWPFFDPTKQSCEERPIFAGQGVGVELRAIIVGMGAPPSGPCSKEVMIAMRQSKLGVRPVR